MGKLFPDAKIKTATFRAMCSCSSKEPCFGLLLVSTCLAPPFLVANFSWIPNSCHQQTAIERTQAFTESLHSERGVSLATPKDQFKDKPFFCNC